MNNFNPQNFLIILYKIHIYTSDNILPTVWQRCSNHSIVYQMSHLFSFEASIKMPKTFPSGDDRSHIGIYPFSYPSSPNASTTIKQTSPSTNAYRTFALPLNARPVLDALTFPSTNRIFYRSVVQLNSHSLWNVSDV